MTASKATRLVSDSSGFHPAVADAASPDDDADVHNPSVAIDIAQQLKTIGTSLFKKGDLENAQKKCTSCWPARGCRS